jgi:hypothetical protein
MHKIIEEELEKMCNTNKLSKPTYMAINKLLSKKIDGDIDGVNFSQDLSRVYDLIKEDIKS